MYTKKREIDRQIIRQVRQKKQRETIKNKWRLKKRYRGDKERKRRKEGQIEKTMMKYINL